MTTPPGARGGPRSGSHSGSSRVVGPDDRTVVAATTTARRAETHDSLDRLLDLRRHRSSLGRRLWGGTGAALLHVVVIGGAILGPQLFAKPPQPVEYVPVQLVPAPARGVERPARAQPKPEATAPPLPEPEPSAAPDPSVAPEDEPTEKRPERTAADPAPSPSAAPPQPATALPGAQGAPNGRADSPFTATVGGVDNPTFTYGYYLDRMLLLIRGQWVRPPLGSGVEATVHFRILRDGTVEEIQLVSSSGYNSFDLAALRALQAAAPLPPLPRSYREGELGVNLIFR
jgi:TonB family protein